MGHSVRVDTIASSSPLYYDLTAKKHPPPSHELVADSRQQIRVMLLVCSVPTTKIEEDPHHVYDISCNPVLTLASFLASRSHCPVLVTFTKKEKVVVRLSRE